MAKKGKPTGKKEEINTGNMVQKQTLYMAILVSITFGFMIGAVYTSFKLAKDTPVRQQASSMPPQQQESNSESETEFAARMGSRILKLEEFLKENPDNAEAWVQLGNLFFDTNRYTDSIEAYNRSLELAPGNPNVLTDLGVMYRRNKAPEKAVEAFDRAIAAAPTHETARFNKGIVLMHDLNNLEGAIKAWEGLVEINPMAEAPNGQLVQNLITGLKQQKQ
ncbi:MAG: tetratricopeptide repeat protein [Desulfobacterales bacterium]|nr:tetratricopeptide repeat protein [Desulfobacterales bacterium]